MQKSTWVQYESKIGTRLFLSNSKWPTRPLGMFRSEKETEDIAYHGQSIAERCLLGLRILEMQNKELRTIIPNAKMTSLDDIKTSLYDILNASYTVKTVKQQVLEVLHCDQEVYKRRSTDNIELSVVNRYMFVPQVRSIYTDQYQEIKRFMIFTTNKKYDNELIEHLLSIEKDIRLSTFRALSFEYIPQLVDSPNEMISKDAKLIYQRGYDVFFSGAYMAGRSQQEISPAID